jgi:Zn-dependent peptidase ImmA (M78 family)
MEKVRATQIALKALQTRKATLGIGAHQPVCPYVLAEAMGFDLRFVNIPSFEGMYLADEHVILISSDRPEGRKRFSCAHEIGHHVLGHGTFIDEVLENGSDSQEEAEANLFASFLLMPSSLVTGAIKRYGKTPETLTHVDVYTLSNYFGVSYLALVTHLYFNLKQIDRSNYQKLSKVDLKKVRKLLLPTAAAGQIVNVADWWQDKVIDIEVGDFVTLHNQCTIEQPHLFKRNLSNNQLVLEATASGIAKAYSSSGWSSFIKISRKKFTGLYQFRYEEEEED